MIEFENDEIDSENDEGISENESNDCGIIENVLQKYVAEDQIYINKETLASVMKNYALHKKFQFKVKRSSATRYHLSCVDDNCDWSFKSSAVHMGKIFKVRHFNNVNTCSFSERYLTQRQATSVVVAGFVVDKLSDSKRNYTPKDIISDMQREHGVKLNYMKAWRAKEKAMEIVRGKPSVSYGELPSYLYMLEYTNPGMVTRLHKSDEGCFLYAFVSLYSSIKGWEYSRPVMVVDRSFLKAAYRGTILTACTLDAAGNILPLAYALVDSENDASWGWFFMQLKNTFGVREGMYIVSDRHDSIQNATCCLPEVPRCFCIYHLWNNVKDLFRKNKEKARPIFFALAKAYTTERCEHYMNELNKIDRRVQPYLVNVGMNGGL
ncbi:uncharacterized protein LOC132031694 [Lycium ferocissimum]|uniref:uncharacterized protein LOC132031694 n=1 Tax=Lycium ferocissimum TaxID=112874 RepID=UPI002814C643|nr:uncharacterized protein LOC132031694 [Lycium ferocissimum]